MVPLKLKVQRSEFFTEIIHKTEGQAQRAPIIVEHSQNIWPPAKIVWQENPAAVSDGLM